MRLHFIGIIIATLTLQACGSDATTNNDNNNSSTYENISTFQIADIPFTVRKIYPHDTSSYTQGLVFVNGKLLEGTGRNGFSKLMYTNLQDGKSTKAISLPYAYFGEGVTLLNGKIYQLTWQNNEVFVYDANTLQKLQTFEWPYEGWGLTHDGKHLIISTGSSNLYFVEPSSFKILKTVGVTDNNGPVGNINELEYIHGYVYANQYGANIIYKIDPTSGRVVGKMDLTGIREKNSIPYNPNDEMLGNVLNGIAYDSATQRMYVTGKLWAAMFELENEKGFR
ncbi:MAG: glutaminyl-peptide cyclotransferase [Chitinophagaceae bacterium]